MNYKTKNFLILLVVMILCIAQVHGQRQADLRLFEQDNNSSHKCFEVQITYHDEEVALGSQNYRIFYSAASLKFDTEQSKMLLPNDQYTFNIVQHNHGIDASGIGDIPFEQNLGFINATIIFNDARAEGVRLYKDKSWVPVVEFCFDITNELMDPEIILARKDLTSAYGRAFVELSYVDKTGTIASLPIRSYHDIKN